MRVLLQREEGEVGEVKMMKRRRVLEREVFVGEGNLLERGGKV